MPILRLTDAPSSSANVLYDFNPSPDQFAGHEGLSWGAPEWTAAPGSVGGFDGPRTVAFNHYMDGGLVGAYSELADLARALLRPDAWLLVQLTSLSEPRWFHVWRSSPAELTPENLFVRDDMPAGLHGINVSLTADPYLYGERVSLPSVTVGSDVTDADLKVYAEFPAIAGDAPAPLRLSCTTVPVAGESWLMTLFSTPGGSDRPAVKDVGTGDGLTTPWVGATVVTDAAWSGGSARSFAGLPSTLTAILDGIFAADIQMGNRLLLVRVGCSDATSVFSMKAASSVIGDPRATDPVVFAAPATVGDGVWVNLGTLAFGDRLPMDMDLSDALTFAIFDLYAASVSGAGDLIVDAVLMVALDDSTGGTAATLIETIFTPTSPSEGEVAWWDGDEELYWAQASGGGVGDTSRAQAGSYLAVSPGNSQAIVATRALASVVAVPGQPKTDALTFTPSYRPRFLWPAP